VAIGGAQRVLLDQAVWLHEHGYEVFAGFLYEKEPLLETWKALYPFPVVCFQAYYLGIEGPRKIINILS